MSSSSYTSYFDPYTQAAEWYEFPHTAGNVTAFQYDASAVDSMENTHATYEPNFPYHNNPMYVAGHADSRDSNFSPFYTGAYHDPQLQRDIGSNRFAQFEYPQSVEDSPPSTSTYYPVMSSPATREPWLDIPSSSSMSQTFPDDSGYYDVDSPHTTASIPDDNSELISGTLHQHAWAKQRRSRHDPGGGASPYDKLNTREMEPDVSLLHYQYMDSPPSASPSSSALHNAVIEMPIAQPRPIVPVRSAVRMLNNEPDQLLREEQPRSKLTPPRKPSPMGHLPYPEDVAKTMGVSAARLLSTRASSESAQSSAPPAIARGTTFGPFTTVPLVVPSQSRGNGSYSPIPLESETFGRTRQLQRSKFKRGTPIRVACTFCRRRKICCGGPPEGKEDRTCNQCARRNLECSYPEGSRRGRRPRAEGEGETPES